MVRTAIILYTVRELDVPLDRILDRIQAAGYDGVQMFGEPRTESVQFPEALSQRGLGHAGRHLSIDTLTEGREDTATLLTEMGCDHVVIPYLDEGHFESVDAVERTATRLDGLADELAEYGISLHYHNHAHEFVECAGRTAFEVLIDRTDSVGFELDVGWAAAGGVDPANLLAEIGDRGPLVHMKDVDSETETPVELGEGDLAVDAAARAAREHADWLIYEHDCPTDPVASIAHGADALANYR